MKRKLLALPLSLALLFVVGCDNEAKIARDAIAGLNGAIVAAVHQHPECREFYGKKTPDVPTQCAVINRAISANNLGVDALETYCGIVPGSAPTTQCKPQKSALPVLQTAVANMAQSLTDINALLKGGGR